MEQSGNASVILPRLSYIAGRLGVSVLIETECHLPIGAGFGLSASALMASAAAINTLFSLGLTEAACAELAHEAEIVHRTGLGDVAACQGGGRDFRTGPGIGARIERFYDLDEPLYAVNFGPLHSPRHPWLIGCSFPYQRRLPRRLSRISGRVFPSLPCVRRKERPALSTNSTTSLFSAGTRGSLRA